MNKSYFLLALALVAGLIATHQVALSQVRYQPQQATDPRAGRIPDAALLTDRGTQLVERLKHLQQQQSSLGGKHPSMPQIQAEIAAVERELAAWRPDNPFNADGGGEVLAEAIPNMNDTDLRQVVLQMAGKINQLEDRIAKLEAGGGGE